MAFDSDPCGWMKVLVLPAVLAACLPREGAVISLFFPTFHCLAVHSCWRWGWGCRDHIPKSHLAMVAWQGARLTAVAFGLCQGSGAWLALPEGKRKPASGLGRTY